MQNSETLARETTSTDLGFRQGSFVVAPIPFESPSLGTGLALGGAYLFQMDEGSDTSTVGLGAFRTSNGSEGVALGGNLAFANGEWSVFVGAADASLNYDLFVLGVPLPVSQNLTGGSASFTRQVRPNLKLGFGLGYGETRIASRRGAVLPPIFRRDQSLDIVRLSLTADHDLRDDTTFPTDGSLIRGTLTQGHVIGGGGRVYEKAVISARAYRPLFREGVIAAQAVFCGASDDAPFFDACSIGGVDAFRGFQATEFIDTGLFSVQAEYRGRLFGRFGFVVFAGAASVGDDVGDALGSSFRTAAGAGLRIRLSRKFPLDYAVDLAINDRDEKLLYVSVGQRF